MTLASSLPHGSIVSAGQVPACPRERGLVDAARTGDRDAFGELVTLHERAVFRATLAALGQVDEAEDAAQDAFVTAWQKLPGFRQQASFRTWLLTIAWRKALDRRRRRRLRWSRFAPAPDDGPAQVDLVAESNASPEQRAVAADLLRRTRAEIRRLSPKLRDALLLACSGAHTYEEIAAMLDVPVGTVKWRVAESRRVLGTRIPGAARKGQA